MRAGVLVGAAAPEVHEAVLIQAKDAASASARPNVLVSGLRFEFRESAARAAIGGDARVLWLSPAARRIIESSRTIGMDGGHLVGRTRHGERCIRAILAEAQTGAKVHQLLAPATGEAPELFLEADDRSRGRNVVIALTIRELDRDMDALPNLTRLFGLTRTEDKIVRMLMQGDSVRAIAAKLGTSVLTVRTHLKRTYAKVNVGTKEQLFSIMLKLMID